MLEDQHAIVKLVVLMQVFVLGQLVGWWIDLVQQYVEKYS